ncbi:bifunctional DNA primase/polymerase [Microlunatus ginsengisoli]|uniref:Bifunctional DNA primase/polymerase n=1 Tax=Microlunatus ginsengisoli TaxID=363863 RepID=A0ABP6ZNC5_9ACTN
MNELPPRMVQLIQAALDYARRGWHVFPTVPGSKVPACPAHTANNCNRADPRCKNGHTTWEQRATRDPGRIRRAWSTRPYGIGIACGPSNLLVIDTDRAKPGANVPEPWASHKVRSGDAVLAELARGRDLPPTWTVATPSGGFHRYYRVPAGVELGSTAGRLGWLIDTRGRGGYVIAPPTRFLTGRYTRLDSPNPALLPDWLVELLAEPLQRPQKPATGPQTRRQQPPASTGVRNPNRYLAAALARESERVQTAVKGTRNLSLFIASIALGQLVGDGLVDEPTVRDLLLAACAGHIGVHGFTTAEAESTIASGLTRGRNETRTTRTGRNVA